ncbi:hypothetical protein MMC13_000817 [Lambiella insularis]|nr:hypothetical protein [Lambiella insularis]
MTESESKNAATKQRIITHMNKDHKDSLARYLEHYCHVSYYYARNARLEDITYTSMTLAVDEICRYVIPIDPPLESWSEARPRVVAMDAAAVEGLKRSGVTVRKYKPPRGLLIVVPIAVACTLVTFSKRSNFESGSFLYDHLLKSVPGFAKFCYHIQPFLFPAVVAIHFAEATHMAKSRLENHSVPRYSLLWWKWVITTFFEGLTNFPRFDRIVKEQEDAGAKTKV